MKTVRQYVDEVSKTYDLDISAKKFREIRSKLSLAGVNDFLRTGDFSLALDIILDSCPSMEKTASAAAAFSGALNVSSSACPRCSSSMGPVKLADNNEALHCSNCNVVIPSV